MEVKSCGWKETIPYGKLQKDNSALGTKSPILVKEKIEHKYQLL